MKYNLIIAVALVVISSNAYAMTTINSDKLVIEEQKDLATFIGNVVYKHEGMVLKSAKMLVFYQPKEGGAKTSRSIKRIEVYDDVEIETPKERATGRSGYYEAAKNTFYLIDDVKMYSANSTMRGEKFIYNKNTGKSLLLGGKDGIGGKPSKPKLIINQE